jgi:hypothetical protein
MEFQQFLDILFVFNQQNAFSAHGAILSRREVEICPH